ncbi:MAG: DNA/RNA non-specific endonuclease, partial [Mucilaginibacter sp.]|nr:DNA/RNA non-specific endonuclease [Mucilaginibacter sp.]
MKHLNKITLKALALAATVFIASSCQIANEPVSSPLNDSAQQTATGRTIKVDAVSLTQGFEVGATSPKTAYDVSPAGSASGDNVTITGTQWNLYDALIGNLAADQRVGSWSARVRNTGKITMLYDVTTGISSVTIKHATYSGDAASTWGLFYSTNGGSSWTQTGSAVTTGATLQTQTFTFSVTGTVRLEIRKLTGGSNRINIDDITI